MLALELAVRLLLGLGLFQRDDLRPILALNAEIESMAERLTPQPQRHGRS
jgi:hypothetical protein